MECLNAEPAKVWYCAVRRIKVLEHVQEVSKACRHQIHSNSPCKKKFTSLGPTSTSAICDVEAQSWSISTCQNCQTAAVCVTTTSRSFWCKRVRQALGRKKQHHQALLDSSRKGSRAICSVEPCTAFDETVSALYIFCISLKTTLETSKTLQTRSACCSCCWNRVTWKVGIM